MLLDVLAYFAVVYGLAFGLTWANTTRRTDGR
jgi:hypothetical protein